MKISQAQFPAQATLERASRSRRVRQLTWPIAVSVSITLVAVLVITVAPARADTDVPTGIPDPSVATSLPADLADPGGIRKELAARGITTGANYIGEYFGVASGGLSRNDRYDGRLELWIDADLETLLGWKGLTFHANAYQIHGSSITAESLGSLAPASYIEADPATRLFEIYVEQSFNDGTLTIRAGQLAADSEFIISDGAVALLNGTWGWPTIAAGNVPQGGPAFPLATPGIRVAINPEGDAGIIAAVYNGLVADDCPPDGNAQTCNPNELDFPLGDGAFVMAEGFYKYKLGPVALPGHIKLGGWLHTGDTQAIDDPEHVFDSNQAIYAILDQRLWNLDRDRHVDVFARIIGSPSDRNEIDLYAEAGVVVFGPFASRPRDILAIGYAYSRISESARRADILGGQTIVRDYESVVELSYMAEIVNGFTVQPDVQYFWNPGGGVRDASGTRAVENALVLGIRSALNY